MSDSYTGPVCYQDGWHYTVTDDGEPGVRLFLDDDGYRAAAANDESWHDRKHQTFATVEMEDGAAALRVTPDQLARIKQILGQEDE
jgi:hypothetical protein